MPSHRLALDSTVLVCVLSYAWTDQPYRRRKSNTAPVNRSRQAARVARIYNARTGDNHGMTIVRRRRRKLGPHYSQDYDLPMNVGPRGPECTDDCDCWQARTPQDFAELGEWARLASEEDNEREG